MSTDARRYYPVRKTGNADNEREQLNKILKAIIDGVEEAGYTDFQKQIDAITYRINGLEIGQSTISEWGSIIGNIADQEDLYDFLQDLTAHINSTSNPHNVTKAQVGLSNVDNTSDLDKPISTATQNALDDKTDNTDFTDHTSNQLNPHNVTKAQVGLSNVDNTSDLDKPISTATQLELDKKADGIDLTAHTADTDNPHSVTKNQVGLGNVDNTSDLNKPISIDTQDALDDKADSTDLANYIPLSDKGANSGVAELDASGKVPAAQLPSFVDEVSEYADLDSFPVTGETGKIYIALDTNKVYRWSGTTYVEISESLALGQTSTTAYRGDRGKIAYDHSLLTTGNPHNVTKSQVGLSNVDNTSDANKPISTATQNALDDKADDLDLTNHINDTNNPHAVTKGDVGLSNVNNTSDLDKPVSTAMQSALDDKADNADLTSHTANLNNPHGVTASQVGAPTVGAFNNHSSRHEAGGADEISVEGLEGVLADPQTPEAHGNESHIVPFAALSALTAHTNDTSNPHNVTWDQTGADKAGSANAVAGDLEDHENLNIQQAHSGNLPENRVVFNTSSGHTHNGVDSAKVSYNDLEDKPSTMPPGTHGNEAHTVDFATEADLSSHVSNTNNPHDVTKADVGLGNVDNTSDLDKPISTATQGALDLKADNLDFNSHLSDTNNPHDVTTSQIGAVPVQRTVSSGTGLVGGGNLSADRTIALSQGAQDSLGLADTALQPDDVGTAAYKDEDDFDPAGSSAAVAGDLLSHEQDTNNPHSVTKSDVGLGNVDNTSDLDKPISTATQNALDDKADDLDLTNHVNDTNNPHAVTAVQTGAIPTSEKASVGGVATLDGNGKVPVDQIPAIAIGETFSVSSEVAMLALSAQMGDVAIRTDTDSRWLLVGEDPTNIDNWHELGSVPDDVVETVTAGNGIDVNGTANVVVSLDAFTQLAIADIVNKADISYVDGHINNASVHRQINDSSTSSTDLWSANKINAGLDTKMDINVDVDRVALSALSPSGYLTDVLIPDDSTIESYYGIGGFPMGLRVKDGGITLDKMAVGSVSDRQIVDAAVDTSKLANGAVTTNKLADIAVTTAKLRNSSVNTLKLADIAVTTDKLRNSSVTSNKIANLAVDTSKLADEAVITDKLADGAVTADKLGTGSVTTDKLQDNAVSTDKLQGNAVITQKIAASAISSSKIMESAVSTDKLQDYSVTSIKLGVGAVTSVKIADNAVGPDALQQWAVERDNIRPSAVDDTKISAYTISPDKLRVPFIETGKWIHTGNYAGGFPQNWNPVIWCDNYFTALNAPSSVQFYVGSSFPPDVPNQSGNVAIYDYGMYVDGLISASGSVYSEEYLVLDVRFKEQDIEWTGEHEWKLPNLDSRLWGHMEGVGRTTINQSDSPGVLLTAGGMNNSARYTPGYMFGSTDPQFETHNPKVLAGIFGRAGHGYSTDDSGLMHITFQTADIPDVSPTLTEKMRLSYNGHLHVKGDVFENSTNFPDYVFDKFLNDKREDYTEEEEKLFEELDSSLFDPEKYAKKWKENKRLPRMESLVGDKDEDGYSTVSISDKINALVETCELQAIHIEELRNRVMELEDLLTS